MKDQIEQSVNRVRPLASNLAIEQAEKEKADIVLATDPDGDSLTVIGISSSSGTLIRTEDGGWEEFREV